MQLEGSLNGYKSLIEEGGVAVVLHLTGNSAESLMATRLPLRALGVWGSKCINVFAVVMFALVVSATFWQLHTPRPANLQCNECARGAF